MNIGEIIKQKRIEKEMTLDDLAKKIGVSAPTVSRWESGKIEDMKRSRIKALSDTLDIPVRVLMGWDESEISDRTDVNVEWYLDAETKQLAQWLHDSPDLRILLDAGKKLPPDKLKALIALISPHIGEDE